jgi:hypothetical protein
MRFLSGWRVCSVSPCRKARLYDKAFAAKHRDTALQQGFMKGLCGKAVCNGAMFRCWNVAMLPFVSPYFPPSVNAQ